MREEQREKLSMPLAFSASLYIIFHLPSDRSLLVFREKKKDYRRQCIQNASEKIKVEENLNVNPFKWYSEAFNGVEQRQKIIEN